MPVIEMFNTHVILLLEGTDYNSFYINVLKTQFNNLHSSRMGSIGCIFCIQGVVKMQKKEFEKQCFQYTLLTFVSSIQILILLTVSDFKNLSGYY